MYELRIKKIRQSRNITQREMAEYLMVHQTTYSDYELGKINVPVPALHKLADYYGVSVDWLLGRTDEPEPYPAPKKA